MIAPIQQTQLWARGIEALGGRTLWLEDSSKRLFGLLHELPSEPGILQCMHGPVLDWELPVPELSRQFALFMQDALLAWNERYHFVPQTLRLKPRLLKDRWQSLTAAGFSIPWSEVEESSTLIKPLLADEPELFATLSSRMKRTIRGTLKADLDFYWAPFDSRLEGFDLYLQSLTFSGRRKGFRVPSVEWFKSLNTPQESEACFFLAQARSQASTARAWVAIHGETAHFLFGETVGPKLPGRIALGAAVQWFAMNESRQLGARHYDFHGLLPQSATPNTYEGVATFKKQFNGEVLHFSHPTFEIETS